MSTNASSKLAVPLVLVLVLLVPPLESQQQKEPSIKPRPSASELFSKTAKSTVMVTALDADGQPVSRASGFIFTPLFDLVAEDTASPKAAADRSGKPAPVPKPIELTADQVEEASIVVTNLHAMKWANSAVVKPYGVEARLPVDTVLAFDIVHDLCWLEVSSQTGKSLQVATVQPKVGDPIYVIGNPLGLEGTFSSGMVAALRGEDEIQIDAPISPGSSGGPVLNSSGQVVGIATSTMVGGQNLNFAVPARFVAKMPLSGQISVKIAGALAISDLEYEHLKGPVRAYTETVTQVEHPEDDRLSFGPELVSLAETFDRFGRKVKLESYRSGAPNGQNLWEYGSDGIEDTFINVGVNGQREEYKFKGEDRALLIAARRPYSISVTSASGETVFKYNGRGNDIEAVTGKKRRVTTYDAEDREVEMKAFYDGYPDFSTRSTYENDAYGNWTKKEESIWLSGFPQFGYRLATVYRRRISYFSDR
jgi:S1-C subfamily serine protease